MKEVEKARETFDVIQDGKAQNLTSKFNEGVNIVETENSSTEQMFTVDISIHKSSS